ncbi:hypothetical protein GIB67_020520, partial [Kingdonia uniflora]
WDKHVGYRYVNVMFFKQNQSSSWKHVISHNGNEGEVDDEDESEDRYEGHEEWGLLNFLESSELSDVLFVIGAEENVAHAHKILEPQLGPLRDLGIQFKVVSLVKQCEEILECFKGNKELFESGNKVEFLHPCSRPQRCVVFPFELPISVQRLTQILSTSDYCDLDIYIEGHGLVAQAHKLIHSLWSIPFMKMYTNGMCESGSSKIFLSDVSLEAFAVIEKGGFKLFEEDKSYMQTCKVVVSTCTFGGGDDLYQPIGMSPASFEKVCYVAFWDEITFATQEADGKKINEDRMIDSKFQFWRDPLGVLEALLWRTNSILAISEHGARSSVYDEAKVVVHKNKAPPKEATKDSSPPDGVRGINCIMKDMYGRTVAYGSIQLSGVAPEGFYRVIVDDYSR